MSSPEIIGIGAVNVDYIIDSRSLGHGFDHAAANPLEGFDYGSERSATATEIDQALRRLQALEPVPSPGGSSLNTLATIAASGAPVSLGYVGVRGTAPVDGFSFSDWFRSLNIDDRFVAPVDDVTGICLSYTDGGQRSMLTTDGANRFIMSHIEDNADALLAYLGGAKLILVTSFANLDDIGPLVELMWSVRRRHPSVRISVDPGALWSIGAVPTGVGELVDLADWVLVNQQEYEALAERRPDLPEGQAVLVKHADHIDIHATSDRRATHHRLTNPDVLAAEEVVDDTGAGDAFAAGFLTSLVTPGLDPDDGVELGFRLAREKLRWSGLSGLHRYGEIYRNFADR